MGLGLAYVAGNDLRSIAAEANDKASTMRQAELLKQFCSDCHFGEESEANIQLDQMLSIGTYVDDFRQWERVVAMLEQKGMPPEDSPQPTDVQRRQLISLIEDGLKRAAGKHAGDPGLVVMRRLTDAEYAYTIRDLTGLDVKFDSASDAVGGEGFTNIGVVQFVQDSTLERYLESARIIADHAVIGSGPLQFFRDPGKTGFELSAIDRVQEIYRTHGFRTASGEGGKPYGMDKYARAFFAAWRYEHRNLLGLGDISLESLAKDEQLDVRFLEHIWGVLGQGSPTFPTSEIVDRWKALPGPTDDAGQNTTVREACDQIYQVLHKWQRQLAKAVSHEEQAAVLTDASFEASNERLRKAGLEVPAEPDAFQAWIAGAIEFARQLPQVSHREPAPSDRDPIPQPFDNTYNVAERNHFHYRVKYHRDDRFLVENIVDDATRVRLDEAWTDLLTSFEYHDVFLRFVAEKYDVNLADRRIGDLEPAWIAALPSEPREYIANLHEEYRAMYGQRKAAEPKHLANVLRFASRAWRRPLSLQEQNKLGAYYGQLRDDQELDHVEAIRLLLVRVLVSPNFIYRAERPPQETPVTSLRDWELATRLSYFLWSSMPDAKLRELAAQQKIKEPEQLVQQTRRMLRDAKARRFATEFFGQWFGFYQFDRFQGADRDRFPEFDGRLQAAMYDEAVSFFEHIVRQDRPVEEILFADYAFLNRELADHYGMALDVQTDSLTRVPNANRHQRGGLLGLGAVLSVTSAPLRTSPVKRGDWLLRRVVGTPVPPPPPDAGSIAADDVTSDGRTLRERLDAHRRDPACVNCHSRIDPLGFALEHYDPIGRWREAYRDGQPIDDSGTLDDGTRIDGPSGLLSYLRQHRDDFHRTLCTKLVGYALGRSTQLSDSVLIGDMMSELDENAKFSELVAKVVASRQFRYRRGRDSLATARSMNPSALARRSTEE